MDAAHWPHQDIGLVKPMEELIPSSSAAAVGGNNVMTTPPQQLMGGGGGGGGGERRVRPQKEQALNCPRCNSTNTKFCYYNNYSLTQPRYFCKTCRRYWTEGGSLRNVPVGGGSRKNKRSSSSSSTSASSAANASSSASANTSSLTTSLPTLSSSASSSSSKNPKFQEGQDLNLAFPALPEFGACTNAAATTATNLSAMELLRSTGMQQGMRAPLNPFMPTHPMAIPEYPSGFGVQDFRANSLSFPLDGVASGGYGAGLQEGGAGRLLFPFEQSRGPVSSNAGGGGADQFDQNNKGEPPGFWNGMMGGGGGGGGGSW